MTGALDRLGGRKFIMAIIVMLIGLSVELNTANGLSTEMAALLTMIYATFSATNAVVTNKQLSVSTSSPTVADTQPPVEPVQQIEEPAKQPEVNEAEAMKAMLNQIGPLLGQLGNELAAIKEGQQLHSQTINTMQRGLSAVMSKSASL